MRRVLFSLIAAGLFVWSGFYLVSMVAERLPKPLMWAALAPFAPGLGVAASTTHLGLNDPSDLKWWLFFYGVDAAVWVMVFYGLVTDVRPPQGAPPQVGVAATRWATNQRVVRRPVVPGA